MDGSCFDISETRLGTSRGQTQAKPMERTLEGWRKAGEIVSRWVWIHLKVGEPEGADISSMSELAREKPRMAP